MKDEEIYLLATNEVEGEEKQPALWAKVLTLAEGDSDKAKYQYIKLRVAQLIAEKEEVKPVVTKNISNEFDIKYMPVSEFSTIKSIPEKKVIEMIRDGFYVGQIKDNQWFVSRNEVDEKEGRKEKTTKNIKNTNTNNQVTHSNNQNEGTAKIIYILYIVSIVIGLTGIVGLIMAYVNKEDAPEWLQTHYQLQIRSFWIGLLYLFIGLLTIQIVIGVFIILFWMAWLVVRCTKGMKYLGRQEAYPEPTGWFF